AALVLGAKAVQVGTAFIGSNESAAIPAYKEALRHARDTDTVLTKSFSGRWARGLRNKFITEVENSGVEIPAYPVQGGLTLPIRMAAQQRNNKEFTTLWCGQSPVKNANLFVEEIFGNLINEAEQIN
ncbi:MAG TPA: nitronate monooxygenase, partial [Chitinophagaceae bacterium]|nr:nitronate monooxygenase [Chitinophagaceae bacterium]